MTPAALRLMRLSAHLDHLDRLIEAMQTNDVSACVAALNRLSADTAVPIALRNGAWKLAEAIRRGMES